MWQYLYYNYAVGIFLFIIDRLFLRYTMTEEEEEQAKLAIRKDLFNLETTINRGVDEEDRFSAKDMYNRLEKLRNNEWLRQLVVFIMFLLPLINVYLFYGSIKKKITRVKK